MIAKKLQQKKKNKSIYQQLLSRSLSANECSDLWRQYRKVLEEEFNENLSLGRNKELLLI